MSEPTLSVRLLWPFLRVQSGTAPAAPLPEAGLDARALADPDTRFPYSVAMDLLERAVARTNDPTLGLRAAECLEPGDLGVLEYAARTCDTLRGALACMRRYIALVNGAVTASLEERGEQAIWRLAVPAGLRQHPAADDFQLACSVVVSRRLTGEDPSYVEVHFAHPPPVSVAAYERVFGPNLRFAAPVNALVFRRADLEKKLRLAHPGLREGYVLHAEEALGRLEQTQGSAARVRALLVEHLRSGDFGPPTIARRLATSPATLRRRLEEEHTSLSDLVADVRRELVEKYLADPALSISEVAFLLGFSTVPAFYKAFRRWHPGTTPADFRKALASGA